MPPRSTGPHGRTSVAHKNGHRRTQTKPLFVCVFLWPPFPWLSVDFYRLSAAAVVVVVLDLVGVAFRCFRCSSILRRGTPFFIQSGAGAPFRWWSKNSFIRTV